MILIDADTARPARLAIIGGGLTGAALLIRPVRAGHAPSAIDTVEPAADLGRGVAYGTPTRTTASTCRAAA